jgi:uncharacterized BrkB/YihY/UPF0761 family membrane protein
MALAATVSWVFTALSFIVVMFFTFDYIWSAPKDGHERAGFKSKLTVSFILIFVISAIISIILTALYSGIKT